MNCMNMNMTNQAWRQHLACPHSGMHAVWGQWEGAVAPLPSACNGSQRSVKPVQENTEYCVLKEKVTSLAIITSYILKMIDVNNT